MDSHIIREFCGDLLARWSKGEQKPAKQYVAAEPALRGDGNALVQLFATEAKAARGQRRPDEEYLAELKSEIDAGLCAEHFLAALQDELNQLTVSAATPERGSFGKPQIADYGNLVELGHGGMGVVYKARQRSLPRHVAIKMIHNEELTNKEAVARFHEEMRILAELHHPNIVQVFASGDCNGQPYFVMEHMDGGSLKAYLEQQAISRRDAVILMAHLALAVQAAHDLGIVHRDLKPANVLLFKPAPGSSLEPSMAKISDFGLALRRRQHDKLTATNAILGTPAYMAPEQGKSANVGPTADVYALGVILTEILTGERDLQNASPGDSDVNSLATARPSLVLDPELFRICSKCMQPNPRERYQTARSLAEDLKCFLVAAEAKCVPETPVANACHERRPSHFSYGIAGVAVALGLLIVSVAMFTAGSPTTATAPTLTANLPEGSSLDDIVIGQHFVIRLATDAAEPDTVLWSCTDKCGALNHKGNGVLATYTARAPGVETVTAHVGQSIARLSFQVVGPFSSDSQ